VNARTGLFNLYSGEVMSHNTELSGLNGSAIDPKSIKITAPAYTLKKAKSSGPESPPEQCHRGKRSQHSNPLIKQLDDAVKAGDINKKFIAHSLAKWMSACNIRKGDGAAYKNFKAGSFLCSSYIKKKNKTNRNSVWLDRRKNKDGVYEYWFVD
jgi:hypothetical protein